MKKFSGLRWWKNINEEMGYMTWKWIFSSNNFPRNFCFAFLSKAHFLSNVIWAMTYCSIASELCICIESVLGMFTYKSAFFSHMEEKNHFEIPTFRLFIENRSKLIGVLSFLQVSFLSHSISSNVSKIQFNLPRSIWSSFFGTSLVLFLFSVYPTQVLSNIVVGWVEYNFIRTPWRSLRLIGHIENIERSSSSIDCLHTLKAFCISHCFRLLRKTSSHIWHTNDMEHFYFYLLSSELNWMELINVNRCCLWTVWLLRKWEFSPECDTRAYGTLRQNEFIFFRVYSFYAKKIWCPIVVLFLIGVVLDFLFV